MLKYKNRKVATYISFALMPLAGTFIIEHVMYYSPIAAGYASLFSGLALLFGSLLSKALLHKPFFEKLKVANIVLLLPIVLMVVSIPISNTIYTLVFFSFLIQFCAGFIYINYPAFCLGRFPEMEGVVSGACEGATNLITSASSYVIVKVLRPLLQAGLGYGDLVIFLSIFLILHLILKGSLMAEINKRPNYHIGKVRALT